MLLVSYSAHSSCDTYVHIYITILIRFVHYIYTIAAEANKHRNAVLPILTDMTEGLKQETSYYGALWSLTFIIQLAGKINSKYVFCLFGDQGSSSRTVK